MPEEKKNSLQQEFVNYIYKTRQPDGFWPSYWWRQPYYSTYVNLFVLKELNLKDTHTFEYFGDHKFSNAFDLACFIGIRSLCGDYLQKIMPFVERLINMQNRDGSWSGDANLRVTAQDCYRPWENPVGRYYKDKHGTITTAMVLRVLTALL